jgi:hypothetical protein
MHGSKIEKTQDSGVFSNKEIWETIPAAPHDIHLAVNFSLPPQTHQATTAHRFNKSVEPINIPRPTFP